MNSYNRLRYEPNDSETRIERCRRCSVPARYIFAAVVSLGLFFTMSTLMSPPVALPVMVRRNATSSTDNNTADVCMFGATTHNDSGNQNGEFDWDEVMQGYILTANSYGVVPSMLLAGRLAEVWSPKHMFTISTLASVAMQMLFPITARWSTDGIIVLQFAAGLLMGAPTPALNAMISSWIPPEERQKLAGIMFSSASIGGIAANSFTGLIVDSLGWEYAFYILPSVLLAWCFLWFFLVYDTPDKHPRISEEELAYIAANNEKDQAQTVSRLPWKEMLTSPPTWAHLTMALAPSWLMNTYIANLPTYMVDTLHYTSTQAGYLLSIPLLFNCLSLIAFGFIGQWLQKHRYIGHLMSYHILNGVATLGAAACLIAVPQVGCNEIAVLVLLVAAATCSAAYIGGSKLNHMDLAVNYAGTLGGVQAAIDMLGSIIAPTINCIITNNQQTLTAWNKVFYITAAVNVFFFIVFLVFGSVEEQPWNRYEIEDDKDKNQERIGPSAAIDVVQTLK